MKAMWPWPNSHSCNSSRNATSEGGFTLLEVMIALTVFAVFSVMFVAGQSGNLADSMQMREETVLRNLCVNKINEILNNPPELNDQLTVSKENKTFDDYPDYDYTIEYKKLKIPDLSKLAGGQGNQDSEQSPEEGGDGGDNGDGAQASRSSVNAMVMKSVKENMEQLVWQVKVTTKNKKTGFPYELSSWIYNRNARVRFEGL